MQKIKDLAHNHNLNEVLLILLILSFPFGSAFLSFSVGFMTVYPYLVILSVLTCFGVLQRSVPESWVEKYYLVFLLLFLVYSLAFIPFVDNVSYALVDIRSIFLMLATGYVLLIQSRFLGAERWKNALAFALKLVFILICAFGAFEFVTGIHFQGESTDHIVERGVVDMAAYSPMFLWDNPNNFFVYQVLCGSLIILLEPDSKKRTYTALIVYSLSFVFSILVLSRIGQFLSVTCLIVSFGVYVGQKIISNPHFFRKTIWYAVFTGGVLLLVYNTKEKFYGIPNERKMRLTAIAPVFPELHQKYLESKQQEEARRGTVSVPAVPDSMKTAERNSDDERLALFKNGVEFFTDSKGLGVGPGQYRYLHEAGQIRNYAFGNNGAHFWLIELASQFGALILAGYLFLLFSIFIAFWYLLKRDWSYAAYFFLACMCFAASSMMPSAFLILDINWIFTAVAVVLTASVFLKTKTPEHV